MSHLPSRDDFLTKLHRELAKNRKITRASARKLAHELRPVLWDAAKIVREQPLDDQLFVKAPDAAREELRRTSEVKAHATALLVWLPHRYGALASGWGFIQATRDALNDLLQTADAIAEERRPRAKRRRGRRPDLRRKRLSEFVAGQLVNVGIRPTTASGGTFARVLSVVQDAAALPGDNIARDVREALANPVIARYIQNSDRIQHK